MPDIGYRFVLHDPLLRESAEFDMWAQEAVTEVPHLLGVTPLPGGDYDSQSQGIGLQRVSLRFSYGQGSVSIAGRQMNGHQAFNFFEENCYRRYLALKKELPPARQKDLKLEFHDWERSRHYYCEIATFTNPRDTSNRMFLEGTLELHLLKEITPDISKLQEPDKFAVASRALADFKAGGQKLKAYGLQLKENRDKVSSLVNRNVLQPLDSMIGGLGSFVSGVTSYVTLPLDSLSNISTGIESTISSLGSLINTPLADMAQELRQIKRSVNRLRRSPEVFRDSIDGKLADLQKSFFELEEDDDTTLARSAKQQGQNAAKRSMSSALTSIPYQAGGRVTVKKGDSLHRIAQEQIGDVRQWRVLAELNGLEHPYISETSEPNTVAPGETLLIPVPANTGSPQITQSFGDTEAGDAEAKVYGTDWKTVFSKRGIDRDWQGSDFVRVSGLSCLKQSIENRMATIQGDLLGHSDYGRPDNRGKKGTPSDYLLQKFRTEKSIEADSRIESAEVTIQVNQNVAQYLYKIKPVNATTGRNVEGVVSV